MNEEMICEKVKNRVCPGGYCAHAKKHKKNTGCSSTLGGAHCAFCVPVTPKWVQAIATEALSPNRWYYRHVGQPYHVQREVGEMYKVWDETVVRSMFKYDCEPCDPPEEKTCKSCRFRTSVCTKPCGGHSLWEPIPHHQVKPISLKLLWNAQQDKNDLEFLKEWALFINMIVKAFNTPQKWSAVFPHSRVKKMIRKSGRWKDISDAMLAYAEHHGFIGRDGIIHVDAFDPLPPEKTCISCRSWDHPCAMPDPCNNHSLWEPNPSVKDTGGVCGVCGWIPAVNVEGTYWLCGKCVKAKMDERRPCTRSCHLHPAVRSPIMPGGCHYEISGECTHPVATPELMERVRDLEEAVTESEYRIEHLDTERVRLTKI